MTPLELIEAGIKTGDWTKICDGYYTLTGRKLPSPGSSPSGIARERVLEIARMLTRLADEDRVTRGGPTSQPEATTALAEPLPDAEIGEETDDGEDRIKPEDIDGDGPNEPVIAVGEAEKGSHYGEMKFLSRSDVDPKEVARNQRRAVRAARRKQPRPPAEKHTIQCTDCERPFESQYPPIKGVGQKCPRCIRNRRR